MGNPLVYYRQVAIHPLNRKSCAKRDSVRLGQRSTPQQRRRPEERDPLAYGVHDCPDDCPDDLLWFDLYTHRFIIAWLDFCPDHDL